jgi:hypothetical protein
MQLNVYIPKEKASLLRRLDEAAKRRGRPKNALVIEAIEAYLHEATPAEFVPANIGVGELPSRQLLYGEWLCGGDISR